MTRRGLRAAALVCVYVAFAPAIMALGLVLLAAERAPE